MPNWDEDSPELRENLRVVLKGIRDAALKRQKPSLKMIRGWHRETMKGLNVPNSACVGKFRGQAGLESIEVNIGSHTGTPSDEVAVETNQFISRLGMIVERLDNAIAPGEDLTADHFNAVLEAIAWAHSEWVRIHPFVNGNGRTARLLANALAMRYGLPPFVRLRPRPNYGYGKAAKASMRGDHRPLVAVFRRMLDDLLSSK